MNAKLEKFYKTVTRITADINKEVESMKAEIAQYEAKLEDAKKAVKDAAEKNDITSYRDAQIDVSFYTDVIENKKSKLTPYETGCEEFTAKIIKLCKDENKIFEEVSTENNDKLYKMLDEIDKFLDDYNSSYLQVDQAVTDLINLYSGNKTATRYAHVSLPVSLKYPGRLMTAVKEFRNEYKRKHNLK